MEDQNLTSKIIGCAYSVFNELGFGFLESVYEKSLFFELSDKGLVAVAQQPVDVFYKGHQVGAFVADIIVEDKVIIELKSVLRLLEIHEVQLVNYLVATGISTGLLINFGKTGVEVKRKYREFQASRDSHTETMRFERSGYQSDCQD